MGRFSSVRANEIEYSLHLVFNRNGDVRMSRGQPALAAGERSVALSVTLPMALFRTPSLSAKLTVDAPDPSTIPQIDVQAAESALRAVVGCDVQITVTQEGQQ